MSVYRSKTTPHGRNMAGACGFWRQAGMTDEDFGKPRKPLGRKRKASTALRAYAAMTTNASKGAVRDVSQLERRGR